MVRTPRRLDAHGPEFLGNRGSRTFQNSEEPGVTVPAAGVIEVQCLRCNKAWRRRFAEIYSNAYGDQKMCLGCPNKLCSGKHGDWGTLFRDAEGNETSFE